MNLFENLLLMKEVSANDEKIYKFILFKSSDIISIKIIDKYIIEKLNDCNLYIIYESHIFNNLTPNEYKTFCNHTGIEQSLKSITKNVEIITQGVGGTRSKKEFNISRGNEVDNPIILPDEFEVWINKHNIKR